MEQYEKLAVIDKWLDEHKDSGYYLTEINKEYVIGDAYGPMSNGRYRSIDEFYLYVSIQNKIDRVKKLKNKFYYIISKIEPFEDRLSNKIKNIRFRIYNKIN